MTKRIRQIAAVLRDSAGAKLPICLKVTTLALSDSATVVDEAVVEVSLASGNIPDGNYVLEYSCLGSFRGSVRIKYGTLISAA